TGHASLVPESAGYVLLGVGRAMAGVPIRLRAQRVLITSEGGVALHGPKEASKSDRAADKLRRLMSELLDLAHGSAPALRQVADGTRGGEGVDGSFTA